MKEVSGKVCLRYLTRHWKKHPGRGKEKLVEFLKAISQTSRAKRKQFEFFTRLKVPHPLTKKEGEAWAKKTVAQIKSRGLGTLQLFMISDLFDEWWNGEWKIKKRELVRLKGELHRRARKNLKKANKVKEDKAELKRQRMQEEKRREKPMEPGMEPAGERKSQARLGKSGQTVDAQPSPLPSIGSAPRQAKRVIKPTLR